MVWLGFFSFKKRFHLLQLISYLLEIRLPPPGSGAQRVNGLESFAPDAQFGCKQYFLEPMCQPWTLLDNTLINKKKIQITALTDQISQPSSLSPKHQIRAFVCLFFLPVAWRIL